MSVNEELSEQAEHAKEPFERMVAVSMAIIASALAIVSVLGHIFGNEELLAQQKASDQWAYYQAKAIRRYDSEIARDIVKILSGASESAKVEKVAKTSAASDPSPVEKYAKNLDRYEKEGDEIQVEAKKLEAESKLRGEQALRMHLGEVFLEIGIVFASLAILTKRRAVFSAAIVSACVGVAIAATMLMIK